MSEKTAVISGITGQTASYLAELLISKDYYVVGIKRRTTSPNYENIASIQNHPNFEIVTGDITDYSSVSGIVEKYNPDEVYNLAAQSFVKASFDQPFHTFDVDTLGVLNWLEVIRQKKNTVKFYQASTSEMFGKNYSTREVATGNFVEHPLMTDYDGRPVIVPEYKTEKYQDEETPLIPQSPYGIAKLASHHLVRLYREAYGIQAACGILFNHESPRRGKEFVTRKITDYVGQLVRADKDSEYEGNADIFNKFPKLALGNLDAYRDWGFAGDYAEAQWMILQQEKLEDFVICTGETHTVREFCDISFSFAGLDYRDYVVVDPKFYRPAEVNYLCGDSTKAKKKLNWKPRCSFIELVQKMVEADIRRYSC